MISNLKDSFKDSVIYGLGSIATKAAGFILMPIYTKYFSVTEYGILATLEATSMAVIAIFSLSLYQAFFVWYWDPEYAKRQKRLFYTILSTVTLIALMAVILSYFLKEPLSIALLLPVKYKDVFFLLMMASALQIIGNIPAKLLQLQGRAMVYTSANILMLIINIGLSVFLITQKHMGLEAIYIAQTVGGIAYLLFLSGFIIRNIEFGFEWSSLRNMIVFALPLVVASIAQIVISLSDRFVMHFSHLDSQLGLYSTGAKLANTITVLVVAPIQMAINPMLVRIFNRDENYKRFFSKIMTYIALGVMFCILFFSFFGYEIVKTITSRKEYWDAYKIIPILAFSALFIVMKDLGVINLSLVKKTRIISGIVISISLLNICLNLLLIPRIGYFGAGISALFSQIIYFILMHYFTRKYNSIPYEYKKVFLMIFIGTVMTLIVLYFNDIYVVFRLALKVIFLVAFPFILYYLNFFEPIEKQRIKEIWNKWKHHQKIRMNIKDLFS